MKDAGERGTRDQTVSVPGRGTLAFFLVFFYGAAWLAVFPRPLFLKKKLKGFWQVTETGWTPLEIRST
jgi:hypothetical protein